jgi:7-carboxy-7-deazaguanine synthase
MAELRLVEHYASVQGEGPRVGVPTQFVRFAGCNMRCPLWPCDTQHAIDPAIWRTNSRKVTADELAQAVIQMAEATGATNICLTGGEPFMQNNDELQRFVENLQFSEKTFTVEAFTNGSFEWPSWALQSIYFILDWKLAGSGEAMTARDTRLLNARQMGTQDVIKFTIVDQEDFEEAVTWTEYFEAKSGTQYSPLFYAGVVWNAPMTNEDLIERILDNQLPWNLNVQIHKTIWSPDRTGV